jgi:hypothetical protein
VFFSTLAEESGAPENELREVFHVSNDAVQVALPARKLGAGTAEQGRTVIVLVAGAIRGGTGQTSMPLGAIRAECERKGCFNIKKFKDPWIADLEGFNAVGQEMVVNPRWVGEFDDVLARVTGRDSAD